MSQETIALAAGAGVATFFSPCAYALLPGYVGYYVGTTETSDAPLGGAVLRGLAGAVGVLVVFVALGALAAAVGETLQPIFPVLEVVVAGVLVVLGVALAAGIDLDVSVPLPARRASVLGFVGFGALYALAAAGCVAPLFLAVTFQSLTLSPVGTVAVFLAYAGVFSVLFVSTTVATAVGNDLAASTVAPYAASATRIAGVVVVAAGLGQLAIALGYA